MQEFGNAITLVGVFVTLFAYVVRRVPLRELEPGLVARWRRGRAWVRRRLGRRPTIVAGVGTSWNVGATISATGMVWRPAQPGDDLAARVEKLEHNLDALRASADELRRQDLELSRAITDKLDQRVTDLDRVVATRHEESRRAETTTAMRWESRPPHHPCRGRDQSRRVSGDARC